MPQIFSARATSPSVSSSLRRRPTRYIRSSSAKKECEAKGFKVVEKGIAEINDIQSAFTALKQAGVDVIYIPTDNTLSNGASTIHALNTGK
ncbi:MAG: hypothetical protein KBT31_06895 [Firmicutes bacterium]|nr:hypothetical protein [Candidatus Colimorpha enterica]